MSILLHDNQVPISLGVATLIFGISSSLLTSGVHLSASVLTVPLLYNLPADTSTRIFSRFYRRHAKIVAPVAAFSTTMFGLSAYLFMGAGLGSTIALGHATGLIFSTFLWTRLVMMRTIRALVDNADGVKLIDGVDQAEVERLLRRWNWMNVFKGCFCFGGALIGLIILSTRASAGA